MKKETSFVTNAILGRTMLNCIKMYGFKGIYDANMYLCISEYDLMVIFDIKEGGHDLKASMTNIA